ERPLWRSPLPADLYDQPDFTRNGGTTARSSTCRGNRFCSLPLPRITSASNRTIKPAHCSASLADILRTVARTAPSPFKGLTDCSIARRSAYGWRAATGRSSHSIPWRLSSYDWTSLCLIWPFPAMTDTAVINLSTRLDISTPALLFCIAALLQTTRLHYAFRINYLL